MKIFLTPYLFVANIFKLFTEYSGITSAVCEMMQWLSGISFPIYLDVYNDPESKLLA